MRNSGSRPGQGRSDPRRPTGRGRSSGASSRSSFDLHRESQRFANDLSDLLNGTICHGIRLKNAVAPGKSKTWVGYEIDRRKDDPQGIPLTIGKAPSCYLNISFVLTADEFGHHLMVCSSYIGIYRDRELKQCLLHYDYERNKRDGYPESHLQVTADSEHWRAFLDSSPQAKDNLRHLHLPAGARRFRPTVEDIIEFIIVERIAEARDGWQRTLNASRDRFHRRQLRAAVRRHPDIAAEQLREQGYRVEPVDDHAA
jgi:hypothetical protein